MRLIETAELVDAVEKFRRDAEDDALVFAMDIGVQSAEVRHARGCSHAAEETVALDKQGLAACAAGGDRRRDPGGASAEHDDLEFANDGRRARRFVESRYRCHDRLSVCEKEPSSVGDAERHPAVDDDFRAGDEARGWRG